MTGNDKWSRRYAMKFDGAMGVWGPITVDSPLYKAQADEVIAYRATLVDSQKAIAEY